VIIEEVDGLKDENILNRQNDMGWKYMIRHIKRVWEVWQKQRT